MQTDTLHIQRGGGGGGGRETQRETVVPLYFLLKPCCPSLKFQEMLQETADKMTLGIYDCAL